MVFYTVKVAIVGDGCVGKTSLLQKYCLGEFAHDYIPTVIDFYERNISDKRGNYAKLQFMDMAGQDDYINLRKHYYDDSIDIIIIAFSVENRTSFINVKDLWLPEIKTNKYLKNKPIIFVGTKLDLRSRSRKNRSKYVSKLEGEWLANEYNSEYRECSSETGEGIDEVIDVFLKIITNSKNKNNNSLNQSCIIS